MRWLTRRLAVVAGAGLTVVGTGVAWAAWSATGTGAATVSTGEARRLRVEQVTVAGPLYPTGSADVTARVVNPNPFAVRLTGVTFGAVSVVDRLAPSGCTPENSLVSFAGGDVLDVYIGPGRTGTVRLPGAVTMGRLAADGCQGERFDASVSVAAVSTPTRPGR